MIIYNKRSNVCSKKVRKVIDTNICLDYNRGSLKEEIPNKKIAACLVSWVLAYLH